MWVLGSCSPERTGEPSLFDLRERGPAVLAFYGDTTTVEIPAVTRVGQATTVRFTTFAGGCIRKDSTEADVAGLAAEVRAYQRDPNRVAPSLVCTAELRLHDNVAELRFAKAGRAKVRIVGLTQPGDHQFVLQREIEVTP
jgi:hypothetical protein